MHARLHDRDVEAQCLRDLRVRSPFDIAKHEHDAGRGGQLVDRRGQGQAQLDLDAWIVQARRPVDGRGDMSPRLVEQREHLVQRDVVPTAWWAAQLLVGRVRHDPIEPRSERRLTTKGVGLSYHGPERVLHDFLCVLPVAGDAAGQTIRPLAVPSDQGLGGTRLAKPERFNDVVIAVGVGPLRHGVGFPFERQLKIHLAASASTVKARVHLLRRLLCEAGHFYPTLVGWRSPYFGRVGIVSSASAATTGDVSTGGSATAPRTRYALGVMPVMRRTVVAKRLAVPHPTARAIEAV